MYIEMDKRWEYWICVLYVRPSLNIRLSMHRFNRLTNVPVTLRFHSNINIETHFVGVWYYHSGISPIKFHDNITLNFNHIKLKRYVHQRSDGMSKCYSLVKVPCDRWLYCTYIFNEKFFFGFFHGKKYNLKWKETMWHNEIAVLNIFNYKNSHNTNNKTSCHCF